MAFLFCAAVTDPHPLRLCKVFPLPPPYPLHCNPLRPLSCQTSSVLQNSLDPSSPSFTPGFVRGFIITLSSSFVRFSKACTSDRSISFFPQVFLFPFTPSPATVGSEPLFFFSRPPIVTWTCVLTLISLLLFPPPSRPLFLTWPSCVMVGRTYLSSYISTKYFGNSFSMHRP